MNSRIHNHFISGVTKRNNSLEFLTEMLKSFNIYIYTMGTFDYALSVCQSLENLVGESIFSGIIARDGNSEGQSKYIFVLEHLTNNNTIIIDDNSDVWIDENRKNLIKIDPFKYKNYDNYLMDNDLQILKSLICDLKGHITEVGIHSFIETIKICYQSMK